MTKKYKIKKLSQETKEKKINENKLLDPFQNDMHLKTLFAENLV